MSRLSALCPLLILLSACSASLPISATLTPTPGIPTAETLTPTLSKTPTLPENPSRAAFPTLSPTPEATAQLDVNEGRATTKEAFTPVTAEQKQTIIQSIRNSWTLDTNNTATFFLSSLHVLPDGTLYMRLNCMYGQNCVVRASIVQEKEIESKLYKIYQYIWEIVVNKQHRVVVVNYRTGIINLEGEQMNWNKIASAQTGEHVNMRFETGASPADRFNGPLDLWLANIPANPQAWIDLKNSIIDENLSDDILNGTDIDVSNL